MSASSSMEGSGGGVTALVGEMSLLILFLFEPAMLWNGEWEMDEEEEQADFNEDQAESSALLDLGAQSTSRSDLTPTLSMSGRRAA